ncbi:MAG: pyrroline-5-carboxylate reductase [Christensenellaceae bacterium]
MKKYIAGFIGCGNMASAIIKGLQKDGGEAVNVYDVDRSKCAALGHVNICNTMDELADRSDIIFLCVKPNILTDILPGLAKYKKAFVSIAAGVTTQKIKSLLGEDARLQRIMPNTPLMVGKGASCFETPSTLTEDEQAFVAGIFESLGIVKYVDGSLMDSVTGISGSGPAYVYLFIDALAKAGIKHGLADKDAQDLALQTFIGACQMLLHTKKPAEQLIQEVCSPGGTTIEAMQVFEQQDIRGIMEKAVDACVAKSKKLSE